MMEDHLIEKDNGLNGMSADDGGSSDLDDGGSFDLDETEDQGSVGTNAVITPLAQYEPHDGDLGLRRRRRTNLPYSEDDHQHQETHIQNDHHHSRHLQPTPLTKTPSAKFHYKSKFLNHIKFEGSLVNEFYHFLKKPVAQPFYEPHYGRFGCWLGRIKLLFRGCHYYLWNRLMELEEENEVYRMMYLLTFTGAEMTEFLSKCGRLIGLGEGVDVVSRMISRTEIINWTKPSTTLSSPLHCTDIQEGNSNDEEVHGERKGLSKKQIITPSSLLPVNTSHRIDIQEGNSNDEGVHGIRKGWSQKMDFEWIFVITNIVLESMSAISTQLSSKQKPQYALFGMILSYFALLTCIIELIYEGHRHQQIPIWRRRRGAWYYDRPQRGRSFATLNNIFALVCALGQCVVTTINYRFENPIKLTVSPIILAFGVLFSKILKYRQREAL